MFHEKSYLLLCNFDEPNHIKENDVTCSIWGGNWSLSHEEHYRKVLQAVWSDELSKLLSEESINNQLINIAIKCFLTFLGQNWQTHPPEISLEEYLGIEWSSDVDVAVKLQRDSEPIGVNVIFPELLYLALELFGTISNAHHSVLHLWWYFRCKVIHQRVLEDTSATLYSEIEILVAKLWNELQTSAFLLERPRLRVLLLAEISQAYLMYGRVQKAEDYLIKAKAVAGLKLELKGVLGKRTKFQQNNLPQLALSSSIDSTMERPSAETSHSDCALPPDVQLQDDVRLNKIAYSEEVEQADLPSLEQMLCLLNVQYLQKAQPKDNLMEEELQPYIEAILTQKSGPWSIRVAALLIRCKIESTHKRTVERAMQQCEAIVNDKTTVTPTARLSYLWASGLQASWTWRQQLGDLYLSLGLVKAALEEYQRVQLWEDIIVCYTMLQLRHKAAEVIQEQINIKPTVKLYCLLGDATDDIACYEKAWALSEQKSSRAQRHWGNYLFSRKLYEQCIPHFELSVEINSIQERVWLRLGYAALMVEQWELAAKAYRRYTYLQPNSFEAWNNLAKIYVNQGDKQRAYRALMEALRFNYDNWKLWENVVLISMDTGHLDDVVRGVHRLLDLRGKYEDMEVLRVLVTAAGQELEHTEEQCAERLRKRLLELFGRITSIHRDKPEAWQLYADISPSDLLKGQRLLKAYSGYTQDGKWSSNPEKCKIVIELAKSLLEHSKKARQKSEEKNFAEANTQLSSARLTGQAVVRAAEKQNWPECASDLEQLKNMFCDVTEYMKSIM